MKIKINMKKITLLLSISTIIFFASCSNSDDASSTTNVLVKKIIETDTDNTTLTTTDVVYDGNKLVNVITLRDNYRQETKFTYTRNLITKTEEFFNNQLIVTNIYEYNSNDQLILYKSTDTRSDYVTKKEYTYNPNGTILFKEYRGFVPNENELTDTGTIYFLNDEISRIDILSRETNSTTTVTSEYDNKNSLYKNIIGFDKIRIVNGGEIKHNLIKRVKINQSFPENNNTISIEYNYNANNYPISSTTSILTIGNTENLSTQEYFY